MSNILQFDIDDNTESVIKKKNGNDKEHGSVENLTLRRFGTDPVAGLLRELTLLR